MPAPCAQHGASSRWGLRGWSSMRREPRGLRRVGAAGGRTLQLRAGPEPRWQPKPGAERVAPSAGESGAGARGRGQRRPGAGGGAPLPSVAGERSLQSSRNQRFESQRDSPRGRVSKLLGGGRWFLCLVAQGVARKGLGGLALPAMRRLLLETEESGVEEENAGNKGVATECRTGWAFGLNGGRGAVLMSSIAGVAAALGDGLVLLGGQVGKEELLQADLPL